MIKKVQEYFFKLFVSTGEYVVAIADVCSATVKRPPKWRLLMEQFFSIGVLSFFVVTITGLSTGVVLAAQSFYQLSDKGLASLTGLMVAKAMIAELGPVLTAFMVTGRVGSAMCAEIGTMKVTEQIDALKSMAVNPNSYLLAPRFIAGVTMMPILTIYSTIMGIFGGYLISCFFFSMAPSDYFDPMPEHITTFDIATCLIKAAIFGILFVTVCCYKGFKAKGGAAGVGKATTESVVISYICILIADFLLTIALNSIYQEIIFDRR
jgi:phospholipid/cholesterol/gamma-HCH transport system permease protein